jgi:hypothetical protein
LENLIGRTKLAIPEQRSTSGEVLSESRSIDLVASLEERRLHLLLWDRAKEPLIAPEIDAGEGVVYQVPSFHSSILDAVRFPSGAVEFGTISELFKKVSDVYQKHGRFPQDLAAYTTCATLASWIPEILTVPLTLCVSDASTQTPGLFRLLAPVVRRGLAVAELSRRLPFSLHPTLLVDDPMLSAKGRAFWQAANRPGLFVARTQGTVYQFSCSKIVVLQPGDSPDAWGEDAMHLVLPPAELPILSNQLLNSIATEFQPQLEMFRLRILSGMDPFVSGSNPLAKLALPRNLGACIPDDPEIVKILTPLFEAHQEDVLSQRSRDPSFATLEAIWVSSHQQDELSAGEITNRVNAILRSRGVNQEFNVREIGWKLRHLGLTTASNGKCKVLKFADGITGSRIHRCVREFQAKVPFQKDCAYCLALEATDKKPDQ